MHSLKCLYWNMHGITSRITGDKSKDPKFLSIISKYDILCLSELHTQKEISIPGFSSGVAGGARGPWPPSDAYFLGLGGAKIGISRKKIFLLSIFFVFNYQKLDSTKKIYQILSFVVSVVSFDIY